MIIIYLLKLNSVSTTLKSTIFKTIKDDVTGATTGISIFNSSIKDMKENLSNGQGFFYSIFQGNKLNNNDIQGILNYVKAMEGGAEHAEAFSTNLTRCSVAAQKYIIDANNAGKSTEQISAGLKDAAKAGGGFKGVIANIGSAFLNSLIGAGIGVAINLIIAGITNLVKAADEAKKKAAENIVFTSCNKYSYYHYKTMYTVLKSKIDTLNGKEDKLAFLNCLLINNQTISDSKAFEIAIGFFTLGFVNSNISKNLINSLDSFSICIWVLVAVILYFFQLYCATAVKWKFEKSIYEQLKNEL